MGAGRDLCDVLGAGRWQLAEAERAVGVAHPETQPLPMQVDMTDENAVMEAEVERLGRVGIPTYVIYYPDGTYDLLPESITTKMLADALKKASKKYPPAQFVAAKDA